MPQGGRSVSFRAIEIHQPIGDFFVGVMSADDVISISYADIREIENELDSYMGIQRRLSKARVKELSSYVNTYDATFPTAVILAVDEENASWDKDRGELTLIETEKTSLDRIARIIDGQHRVEGLKALEIEKFEVNVSVFVGSDIATQANIFATVNLAQTKVNRSLVYDLFDYEKERSPQKSAHTIAVALDQIPESPFYHRIKRLGTATFGRDSETLTQAAVVEGLLNFITNDPMRDRDSFLRKIGLAKPDEKEMRLRPFRVLFLQGRDADITRIVLHYFWAVREKWPESWDNVDKEGNVLPRTNGFRALMRFLKPSYLHVVGEKIGSVPNKSEFVELFSRVKLRDQDFNTEIFPPGTSGEARLFRFLIGDVFPEQQR